MEKDIVIKKMERVFNSYEDKEKIKAVCVSKKLYLFLNKPQTLFGLEVIVENELYKYAYFFVTGKPYTVPAKAHSIEFKEVRSVALQITRVVSPLYDTARYETQIAARTTMNELAFLIANIIKEMDENKYCKKDEMLRNIDNYLKS